MRNPYPHDLENHESLFRPGAYRAFWRSVYPHHAEGGFNPLT
jgi:hypothetical protein